MLHAFFRDGLVELGERHIHYGMVVPGSCYILNALMRRLDHQPLSPHGDIKRALHLVTILRFSEEHPTDGLFFAASGEHQKRQGHEHTNQKG